MYERKTKKRINFVKMDNGQSTTDKKKVLKHAQNFTPLQVHIQRNVFLEMIHAGFDYMNVSTVTLQEVEKTSRLM